MPTDSRRRNKRDEPQAINDRSLGSVTQEDSERQHTDWIAQRAYQRYEERGCEDGDDIEDWRSAEQKFRRRFNVGRKYTPTSEADEVKRRLSVSGGWPAAESFDPLIRAGVRVASAYSCTVP